jgi:hypothetical protein
MRFHIANAWINRYWVSYGEVSFLFQKQTNTTFQIHRIALSANVTFRLTLPRTRQGGPRTSGEVALARTHVPRRRPRVSWQSFRLVRHKTPARSVSDRPAHADRVRAGHFGASSDEHRIVMTSPVLRHSPFTCIPLSPWRTESETVLVCRGSPW